MKDAFCTRLPGREENLQRGEIPDVGMIVTPEVCPRACPRRGEVGSLCEDERTFSRRAASVLRNMEMRRVGRGRIAQGRICLIYTNLFIRPGFTGTTSYHR